MPEITFIIDELAGEMLAEDNQAFRTDALPQLNQIFGETQELACARPLQISLPNEQIGSEELSVRIAGYYHNSLTEGPGRRSSVLFQFCPLKCQGCYVPELHGKNSGKLISANTLAEKLLDPKYERDGVTILGGEPFAQPEGLLELIEELRSRGCQHIVCYSGYTLESLHEKARTEASIGTVLDKIDILIDGPFIESLSGSAGLWTGSGNQRVIDLKATRMAGQTVLFQFDC